MRNFDYIKNVGLNDLHRYCEAAEQALEISPEMSAVYSRKALEYIVKAFYYLKDLEVPEQASLFALVDNEVFKSFINDYKVMMAVHHVRKVGNNAAHTGAVSKKDAFFALLNVYNVIGSILLKLKAVESVQPFNKDLIPKSSDTPVLISNQDVVTINEENPIVHVADKTALSSEEPVQEVPSNFSEAETRSCFIDLMLKDAGWDVVETKGSIVPRKACVEVEVTGMPNDKGVGYVDYVLFGADSKPLAVVEAKRTSVDKEKGKHQAELYADCLEKKYGVRPVIYYTNGFQISIIDGLGYPPREVLGYHTAEDLRLLIQKRGRSNISDFSVKDSITDREYQKRAIKAVCEHYNGKHRKALLVMATGTGKTRVAISLVDVLMRNKWVKNVLFLADRITLVTQAHKNFVKLLPNATTCVLSDNGNSDKDLNARVIFSTYQTMINYIDTDEKDFSVGRFDLVIIDEAHRSVFGKFGAIFRYFDSLLVGLTATPRDEIDRSTYDLFEMEQGEPNFAYELDEAVADGFWVNYKGVNHHSKIIQEGIKYDELSPEEQKELEQIFEYEKARKNLDIDEPYNRDISSREMFKYIFNTDTIDKVIQDLMTNGLKVNSGDKIGKSIIFAYNHRHAEKIVQRFSVLYPEYGSDFCVLIDNYVTYAHDLIDKFEIRDSNPQIAVSVDMLDTGVDVPDILNLVFFKPIKSKIKFMQMIGRGTRLSENIFGLGKDKECFYIFDWCGNFDFFKVNVNGAESKPVLSLTERLFNVKLDIAFALQSQEYQTDDFARQLHDQLKDFLHQQVVGLNQLHISVRAELEYVVKFSNKANWTYISQVDVIDLKEHITKLLIKNTTNESASKFDLLALTIELSMIDELVKGEKCINKVVHISESLQEKASIPQIRSKLPLLQDVSSPAFWENVTLDKMEKVRVEIRELVQYLEGNGGKTFDVNIEDIIDTDDEVESISFQVSYKQKVIDFLTHNRDLPVLRKIQDVEQLTPDDIKQLEEILWKELGTKKDYEDYLSKQNLSIGDKVAVFIRSVLGVDRQKAIQLFTNFISNEHLNSTQEEYLKTIIDYVCKTGDITTNTIVNESPFDEFNWQDVFGNNLSFIRKYVDKLHEVVVA